MKQIIFISLFFLSISALHAQKSLYTSDTLAVNAVFRQRVKSAGLNAAYNLAADTSKPSYIYVYVNQLINNPDGGWISGMTYQVVQNPVINYNSPDSDIQFEVNSDFDKCAKAFTGVIPTNSNNAVPVPQ